MGFYTKITGLNLKMRWEVTQLGIFLIPGEEAGRHPQLDFGRSITPPVWTERPTTWGGGGGCEGERYVCTLSPGPRSLPPPTSERPL